MIQFNRLLSSSLLLLCPLVTYSDEISDKNNDSFAEPVIYNLIWEDNFEDPDLNEDEHWSVEIDGSGNGNNELQYYRRENISLGTEPQTGEKCLIITAKKDDFMGKNYTSGRLTTQKKISFKYGKIEARMKLPQTRNGLWPAFWMLGADYHISGWPTCGEIDILEMGAMAGIENNVQDRYFNGACHWGASWNNGAYPNYVNNMTSPYSLQDDFHLYTMIWDKNAIRMYLDLDKYPDKEPYFQMDINSFDSQESPGHYFHKHFFVLFNLAVGGNYTQIWDHQLITALNKDNHYEVKMYVDYVRVYQSGNSEEEYSGPVTGSSTNLHYTVSSDSLAQ